MKDLGYGHEYHYEPKYGHPVYQEFLPPELHGTRFLSPPPGTGKLTYQDASNSESTGSAMDVGTRLVDRTLLAEWEEKRNNGRAWSGREALQ